MLAKQKKPGGEMNPPPGLKLWVGAADRFRNSLPDYLETNVSFSSRRPFSWPELSLLFSLP
jgi:hypothetical protein